MGRRRTKDAELPPRVYLHHGAYIYRPPGAPSVRLGTSLMEALRKHAELVAAGVLVAPTGTALSGGRRVGPLLDAFIRDEVPKLAQATQDYYLPFLAKFRSVFADAPPEAVTARDIYAFRSKVSRSDHMQTNCTRVVSAFFKYLIREGAAETNPCRDVLCVPGDVREVCPSFDDIEKLKAAGTPQLGLYIDFKLATGLRQGDLLALPPIPLSAEFFEVEIGKTKRYRRKLKERVGRTEVYEVTDELREILRAIYALPRPQSTLALFTNRLGKPYTSSGFYKVWETAMKAAIEANPELERFHEHDLRATTATADEENAQRRLGHRKKTTTDIYLRRFKGTVTTPLSLERIRAVSGKKR